MLGGRTRGGLVVKVMGGEGVQGRGHIPMVQAEGEEAGSQKAQEGHACP